MYPNINTGVGALMGASVVDNTSIDTTGRFFIVGASSLAGYNEVSAMYPATYPDGTRVLYTTIKAAVAACLAARGDVIFVMPGHTENITSATDLNLNVAGVSVIGLGSGSNVPALTLTTAASAVITLSAANCNFINIAVDGTGVASVTTIFSVTAAGCKIQRCQINTNNATNQAGVALTTTSAANSFIFDSNIVKGTTDAGMTNALQIVGGNDIQITNNYFYGAYTTSLGPINNITTACLRILIANNTLINATASSTKAIVLVSGTTGMIRDNRIAILSGTAPITGAGTFVGGNYYVAAAGVTAGTLI